MLFTAAADQLLPLQGYGAETSCQAVAPVRNARYRCFARRSSASLCSYAFLQAFEQNRSIEFRCTIRPSRPPQWLQHLILPPRGRGRRISVHRKTPAFSVGCLVSRTLSPAGCSNATSGSSINCVHLSGAGPSAWRTADILVHWDAAVKSQGGPLRLILSGQQHDVSPSRLAATLRAPQSFQKSIVAYPILGGLHHRYARI
jgi:hypothetical protein